MEDINLANIDPENPPDNVLVFKKGNDLTDALHTFLLQSGTNGLVLWLATKLTTSRDFGEWMRDIVNTARQNPELGQMVHAFFELMLHLDDREDAYDRIPIIAKALRRRIATLLYRKLDMGRREIRLLKLDPCTPGKNENESKDEPMIQCSLETKSLDDEALQFDALSYVWGDATQVIPIFVDSTLFLATRNLYQALHSFRKNNVVSGYLWIDAICINQQDVEERNFQITLMTHLYRQAKNVRVWMGPESQHTAVLFDKLEDCGGGRQNRPNSSIMNAIKVADVESGSVYGLLNLLKREWWSRVWVVQESALAKDPVIHCGSQSFDFRRLEEVLRVLTTMMSDPKEIERDSPVYRAIAECGLGKIQQVSLLLEMLGKQEVVPTNLFDGTSHCEATVPHDRVYALLGLFPSTLKIIPNYNAQVEDVFESAAASILEWSGCLDLLRITALSKKRKLNLPSWVPEFGNTAEAHYMYRLTANFNADLDATCSIRRVRKGELTVRALVFDQVRVCSEPFDRGFPSPGSLDNFRERLKARRDLWQSVCQDPAADSLAFWQTLTTNRLINPGLGARRWDEDGNLELAKQWDAFLDDRANLDGKALENLISGIWVAHGQSSFFVSAKGRLGLGDAAPIQEGDVIAILAGSKDPAVLRPAPDRGPQEYKFVQNCYCHGVMDGEAIAEALERQSKNEKQKDKADEQNRSIWSAVVANRSSELRYDFQKKQPESFWSDLREAIDPLFEEIVLV